MRGRSVFDLVLGISGVLMALFAKRFKTTGLISKAIFGERVPRLAWSLFYGGLGVALIWFALARG